MTKITLSNLLPQRKQLFSVDPEGEVFVSIKPPGMADEVVRSSHTSKRSYENTVSGTLLTHVDLNTRALWAEEIWLTYNDANIEIELDIGADADPITININRPREKFTRTQFMNELGKLPSQVINEWHFNVLEVVPMWTSPF